MRTTTLTRNYVTIPDTDIEVEVYGPLPDDQSEIHCIDHEDGSRTLSWKVRDDSPMEHEWGEGVTFMDFRNHHDTYGGESGQDGRDAFIADMIVEHGAKHVHLVEVYSHGMDSFSRVDAGVFYPDRRWDVCAACVLVTPKDVTNPTEFADAVLADYTAWCCGDVYGLVRVDVPADYDGGKLDGDSCWGFVGYKYADECVKSGNW